MMMMMTIILLKSCNKDLFFNRSIIHLDMIKIHNVSLPKIAFRNAQSTNNSKQTFKEIGQTNRIYTYFNCKLRNKCYSIYHIH